MMIGPLKPQLAKKIFFLFTSITACFGQIPLDVTFDTDGKVTTPIVTGLNSIYDMALQSDGKIVTVGYALSGINYDIAVARYNTDGSLDLTFNTVGFTVLELGSNDDVAYGVAIQADGKIVVAGSGVNASNTDFVLLRFNTNGTLDNTFDTDGIVNTAFDISYETAYDVAIQADGKIVAAGSAFIDTAYQFAVARYNTNGSLDASFGTGGLTTSLLVSGDEARAMAIQADGKIVLAGTSMQPDFSRAFAVARYTTSGVLDLSFNTTGSVITSISPNNDFAQAMALQPDGKIVVAGKATPVGPEQFAVVRYNTDGSLDNTFNSTGMIMTAFGSTWDEARAVVVQSDGKIIAGGLANVSGQKFAMARYNTDGTMDATFGPGGKITTAFGSSASIWAMAIQTDSKIVAAGYSGSAANYDFAVARYGGSAKPNAIENVGIINNSLVAYPNPFTNQITLTYDLIDTENLTIQLIDAGGKIKATYLSGELQIAGQHQQILAIPGNLANGTYFVVLSSTGGSASVKLVKE